jgi:hypothetical protein
LQVVVLGLELLVYALGLLRLSLDLNWEQTLEPESLSLGPRERGAFVQPRIAQEIRAACRGFNGLLSVLSWISGGQESARQRPALKPKPAMVSEAQEMVQRLTVNGRAGD